MQRLRYERLDYRRETNLSTTEIIVGKRNVVGSGRRAKLIFFLGGGSGTNVA